MFVSDLICTSPRARLKLSDRRHGNRRERVRYSNMVVWFCARLNDHKPNTPFSDVSRPYGVANPCAHRGNRIGGHKNRSFLYGTVRPRVNSECGIMYNPRPLAFEACLKRLALTQQVSMPWNRHHGTESHQNQKKDQKLSEHFTWH